MTAQMIEIELIPVDEPVSEKTCTTKRGGCRRKAVWRVTAVCCGATTYLCDPHNASNNKFIASVIELGWNSTCIACNAKIFGDEIYSAEIVEPI